MFSIKRSFSLLQLQINNLSYEPLTDDGRAELRELLRCLFRDYAQTDYARQVLDKFEYDRNVVRNMITEIIRDLDREISTESHDFSNLDQ